LIEMVAITSGIRN